MLKFDYCRPGSLDEACTLLAECPGSRPIAGGTDLMVQIREPSGRWSNLSCMVDLSFIPELADIRMENGSLWLGAMATHTQIGKSPLVCSLAPVLSAACLTVGSPQIRNRGTLGGAVCNASPASDPVPALLAMEAVVAIAGPNGVRRLPLDGFITAPGRTALKPGELVTGFLLPPSSEFRWTFEKLGRRKALAISRINMAAMARQAPDGTVTDLRLVPGCVYSTPHRAAAVETLLLSKVPTRALLERAAKAMAEDMVCQTGIRWSTEYKQPVLEAITRRALEQVLEVKDDD